MKPKHKLITKIVCIALATLMVASAAYTALYFILALI